ncbi:MAG TPA: AraC family transcriptional regulator [Mobilitalea sp.]|nr:AraC family transcriptional regulator [Mobilitalea sp.]
MNWVYKIQEAIDYIEASLLEEITIDAVGKAINYAPSSFHNLFSAITGYSIGEYIRFRRLSCAADELEEGELTVTEIAFKYGYETVEAFSKAFKRLFSCSPSQYKASSNYHKFHPIKIDIRLWGGFSAISPAGFLVSFSL